MKNVWFWGLPHYSFVRLTPALTQPHSQFENHISIHKIVICVSFISASSLSAAAFSGLWVFSTNTGQNEDKNPFFPLWIMVKYPFSEHTDTQGAHSYTLAI